jgi:hypothetical protein
LGLYFNTLGLHFGVFLEALVLLGTDFGHLGAVCQKWVAKSRESGLRVGTLFSTSSIKNQKNCEKWVSGKA